MRGRVGNVVNEGSVYLQRFYVMLKP